MVRAMIKQAAPGDVIDERYRLDRVIAEGGMGVVYEALHLDLQKPVALKLLRSEIANVAGASTRFQREARALGQLDHPRIVRVTDSGCTANGDFYLVMELLQGRSLGGLLAAEGSLKTERAIAITLQILEGLTVAHGRGFVHRDLKPDNIFLSAGAGEDQIKILDFGIASMSSDGPAAKLTQTGMVMGTPAYMAHEQALGRSDLDARTDLHAVGVMLYEMLAGRTPYLGENYNQIIHAILLGTPPPLEKLVPGLAPAIYATVGRAIAMARAERFATADEMRAALVEQDTPEWKLPAELAITDLRAEGDPRVPPTAPRPTAPRMLSAEPIVALELDRPTPTAPIAPEPASSSSRSSGSALLIALLLLSAVAGGAYFAWQRGMFSSDASIELDHVPSGAKLTLDGTPIVGHHLVLPISAETHVLVLELKGRAPRTLRFSSAHSQHLDLSATEPAR